MRRFGLGALVAGTIACSPAVRVLDLNGISNASVFVAHIDSDDNPREIAGPYEVDDAGLIDVDVSELDGFFDRSEVMAISYEALENYTASLDPSAKGRRRFRRDAPCWQNKSCRISLTIGTPPVDPILQIEPGNSQGILQLAAPSTILSEQLDVPQWLAKVIVGVPVDLELIEPERLRTFGSVTEWANIPETFGLQDFLPISNDEVLVVSFNDICLVDEDMSANEICADPQKRINLSEVQGLRTATGFFRIARHPQGAGRVYAIVTGVPSHLVSFEIADGELTNLRTETSTSTFMQEVAVAPDGTVLATAERNAGEPGGTVHGFELSPSGEQRWELIRRNKPGPYEEEARTTRIAATNSNTRPFVTGTQNAYQVRDTRPEIDRWDNTDFFRLEPFPTSLTVKAIAARQEQSSEFLVWTAHNFGVLFRFELSQLMKPRRVLLQAPQQYVDGCKSMATANEVVADIRTMHVRGPHDAFIVADTCAVLMWFDPNPLEDETPNLSLFMDEAIGQPWNMVAGEIGRHQIHSLGDYVWVGSRASLQRVRQPPLNRVQ